MATGNHAFAVHQPAATVFSRQVRMVVVDDSPDFLDVVCGLIGLEDFIEIVGTAQDGSGAIQAASDLRPDVILMDVQMPYMNGLTTALLLSQHNSSVPWRKSITGLNPPRWQAIKAGKTAAQNSI